MNKRRSQAPNCRSRKLGAGQRVVPALVIGLATALLGTGSVFAAPAPSPTAQAAGTPVLNPAADGPLGAGAAVLAAEIGLPVDVATRRLGNQVIVAEIRRRMFEMQPAALSFRSEESKQATNLIVTAEAGSVRDVAKFLEEQAADLDVTRDVKIRVSASRHPKSEVVSVKDRLKKYFTDRKLQASADIDEGTGRIIVTAAPSEAGSDPATKLTPQDVVGRVADEVDLDIREAKPKSLAGGGEALNNGCTSGFAVADASSSAIATAGHCQFSSPASLTDTSGTPGGSVTLGQPEQKSLNPDRQFQRVLHPGVADPGIVYISTKQRQAIRTVGAPVVGNQVCLFGVSSNKFACGRVLSLNSTTFIVNTASAEGDSGGPVYAGSSALGLVRADAGSVYYAPCTGVATPTCRWSTQTQAQRFDVALAGTGFSLLSTRGVGDLALVPAARVYDTRGSAKLQAGTTYGLQVAGLGGVPVDDRVQDVILNVTVVDESGAGFVNAWPGSDVKPVGSAINFQANTPRAQLVTVPMGFNGQIWISSSQATHLIVDVVGYHCSCTPVNRFLGDQRRIYDSRSSAQIASGQALTISILNPAANAKSVLLNLTAVAPASATFMSVYQYGTSIPQASNLNANAGEEIANFVEVPLVIENGVGKVNIYNGGGSTHFIVDLLGFTTSLTTLSQFVASPSVRYLDSRSNLGTISGAWAAGSARDIAITDVSAAKVVPAGATAVLLNVVATGSTQDGFLTVSCGGTVGSNSTLNYRAGLDRSNHTVVPLCSGKVNIYSSGATHVIADVEGYYYS
jgi:hypothetical protein